MTEMQREELIGRIWKVAKELDNKESDCVDLNDLIKELKHIATDLFTIERM